MYAIHPQNRSSGSGPTPVGVATFSGPIEPLDVRLTLFFANPAKT
jgi:hypothetical protein